LIAYTHVGMKAVRESIARFPLLSPIGFTKSLQQTRREVKNNQSYGFPEHLLPAWKALHLDFIFPLYTITVSKLEARRNFIGTKVSIYR
jgi:hypothetical protein